jgi:ABC-type phosphate/phosphonate transport system substrate-binding protein
MVTKDPSYLEKTKVIQRSAPLANPPVVVHPDIDPALRDQLEGVFLSLHEHQEGRAVLEPLMIDRFIVPDDRSYDLVRQRADEARRRIAQTVLRRLRESRDAEKGSDHSTEVGTP